MDIAPVDLGKNLPRSFVVDFLPTLDDPHQRIFIANPHDSFNWYAYTDPFTAHAWTYICAVALIAPPIVAYIIGTKRGRLEPKREHYSLAGSYAFVSGAITMRDWRVEPSTGRAMVTHLSILFFGTVVFYHWEANIISYLAVRSTPLPFLSMEELLSKSDYKVRQNETNVK